jgi:hypothetical protein
MQDPVRVHAAMLPAAVAPGRKGPVGSNHTEPQPAGTQGCFFGDILVVVPG